MGESRAAADEGRRRTRAGGGRGPGDVRTWLVELLRVHHRRIKERFVDGPCKTRVKLGFRELATTRTEGRRRVPGVVGGGGGRMLGGHGAARFLPRPCRRPTSKSASSFAASGASAAGVSSAVSMASSSAPVSSRTRLSRAKSRPLTRWVCLTSPPRYFESSISFLRRSSACSSSPLEQRLSRAVSKAADGRAGLKKGRASHAARNALEDGDGGLRLLQGLQQLLLLLVVCVFALAPLGRAVAVLCGEKGAATRRSRVSRDAEPRPHATDRRRRTLSSISFCFCRRSSNCLQNREALRERWREAAAAAEASG